MLENSEFKKYATKHVGIPTTTIESYSKTNQVVGITPMILEERQMNVMAMSVFDRLMMDRTIFLNSSIDDQVASIIQAQLLFLESTDTKKDITLMISSGGGSCYAGMGIYDTMEFITPSVATVNVSICASMAAVLLSAGEKGKRSSLPHARFMIHQPLGNTGYGQATELAIYLKEMDEVKKDLYKVLSKTSGNSYEDITLWCDRDNWMRSEEAKEKGFIDQVIKKR